MNANKSISISICMLETSASFYCFYFCKFGAEISAGVSLRNTELLSS